MSKAGLRIAQVAAVVLAIGISTWVIVMAHEQANPTDPTQADPKPGDGLRA